MYLMTDEELRGTISNTVKSSTNLTLGSQDLNRSSTMAADKIEPNLMVQPFPPTADTCAQQENLSSQQAKVQYPVAGKAQNIHLVKGKAFILQMFRETSLVACVFA
ncbi:hypothetical protein P5673_027022 [Acropora cervicornis]|uniref:Uncharacterized protein n=1 Tax=Acropora cervicornis TaxID=6130 RepID=A0AAD9PZK6_ACRCE|nr:hypothetical protein P5673_027022 [Acropora cervicornis]